MHWILILFALSSEGNVALTHIDTFADKDSCVYALATANADITYTSGVSKVEPINGTCVPEHASKDMLAQLQQAMQK